MPQARGMDGPYVFGDMEDNSLVDVEIGTMATGAEAGMGQRPER